MAKQTICNMCEKIVDETYGQPNISIHKRLGYESCFDGCAFDFDLCHECADLMIRELKMRCKLPVIIGGWHEN